MSITPEFRRMGLLDVEDVIDEIDKVFGYKPMDYVLELNLLKFREPIVFTECSFIHLIGVSITIDDQAMYKMYNEEEDSHYYIHAFEM